MLDVSDEMSIQVKLALLASKRIILYYFMGRDMPYFRFAKKQHIWRSAYWCQII